MAEVLRTSGNRALDAEIDLLWSEIRSLRARLNKAQSSNSQVVQQAIDGALEILVQQVGGDPSFFAGGVEFGDGFLVRENGADNLGRIEMIPPDLAGYIRDPTITQGDMLFRNSLGLIDRLPVGLAGQSLIVGVSGEQSFVYMAESVAWDVADVKIANTSGTLATLINTNTFNAALPGDAIRFPKTGDNSILLPWWGVDRNFTSFIYKPTFRLFYYRSNAGAAGGLKTYWQIRACTLALGDNITTATFGAWNSKQEDEPAANGCRWVEIEMTDLGGLFGNGRSTKFEIRRNGGDALDTSAADLDLISLQFTYQRT